MEMDLINSIDRQQNNRVEVLDNRFRECRVVHISMYFTSLLYTIFYISVALWFGNSGGLNFSGIHHFLTK